MGVKDLLKNTILRMDMLSATPTFRTRRETQFETLLGGILSLGIMVAFGYILYLQFVDMFGNLTITYEQGLLEDLSSVNSLTGVQFAIAIDGLNLATTPWKFRYIVNQVELLGFVDGFPQLKTTPIALEPCRVEDWSSLGASFQSQFNTFGVNKMLCMPKSQTFDLAGSIGSSVYKFLNFQILECNHTLQSKCDDPKVIEPYVTAFLSASDYFSVRLYMVDTIITPSNENAITQILEKDIFMSFTKSIGTVGYINMAQYTLQTDDSYWPAPLYSEISGSYIASFQTNSVSISSTKYVNVNIFKSTKSLSITRTLGKIDTVLSYVGGLFGLLFTAIAFFLASYSDINYEIYVADSMLTLDKNGRRLRESDFGFHTYIAYKIYDWLDVFGLAPTCFSTMNDIHRVRQEVCEQLDPVLILKRIKHIENLGEILLSEHREMCMYLTEPMTLDQARHMRHALTYYDRLLQGIEQSRKKKNKDQHKQPRKNTSEQKYLDPQMLPSKSNQTLQEMQIMKSQPDIERADQTEEQQEERIVKMLKQGLKSLQGDDSHISQRIKQRISAQTRKWILQLPSEQVPTPKQQGLLINIY